MRQYLPMHAPVILVALFSLLISLAAQNDEVLKRFAEDREGKIFDTPFDGKWDLGTDEVLVFIGQENLVREQKSAEIESRLVKAFPDQRPQFRSMAWEGDTVYEQRRDLNFGSWEEQLRGIDASVVIAQFGQMEALDGVERLPEFVAAYSRLLDQVSTKTKRLVILSPTPFEKPTSGHAPDLLAKNEVVKAYTDAIQQIAVQRHALFVDLFTPLASPAEGSPRLTHDGIHLNGVGLQRVAEEVAKVLTPDLPTQENPPEFREAIVEKNRLWFDLWRPMNWAFLYGDRTEQAFGQPIGDRPWLKEELTVLVELIEKQEELIHSLARGDAPLSVPEPASNDEKFEVEDPATALAAITPADGFSVNLFASEADGVINPVQIAWDHYSNLYVACSPTYPHIVPGAKPADYILMCTDTDADGKADQFVRYAEGLHMVQGVEPGNGGLYVCAGTELLHFKDLDGDGKADSKQILLSGFGTGDAHQLVNSISHGPDGDLWFTQGLHIHSAIETPYGVSRLEKSGVWRWEQKTGRLEGYFNGAMAGHNCWGVAFDDYNQPFHKSGDRPHGYYLLPGMMAINDPEEYHPRGALFEAPIKTTAIDFIGTEHFPEEFQGLAVLGGFMGNTVDLYRLKDDGAGFSSEKLPDLATSTDEAFRPVDVSVGPDGAVYVCDFHNRLIGHYQTSYRDPGRDNHHGRIWRISANGRHPVVPPKFAAMNAAELIELLGSPERWIRYQAKRLLFDSRRDEVLSAADSRATFWARDVNRLPLLRDLAGVYRAHNAASLPILNALSNAEDPRLRAYSMRLAGAWTEHLNEAEPILLQGTTDDHPRVRLEALVAGTKLPHGKGFQIFQNVYGAPHDRFIEYALINAARLLRPHWQAVLRIDPASITPAQKEFLEQSAGAAQTQKEPGQLLYENICLNCHQPEGKGLPGIYPPLVKNPRVTGNPEPLVQMLLHGLQGPLTTNGTVYNNIMPPSGLSDEEIVLVLTYVRSHFDNAAPGIDVGQVEAMRQKYADRASPWTPEELIPSDTN